MEYAPALVPAEGPVRGQVGRADDHLVLLDDLLRAGSCVREPIIRKVKMGNRSASRGAVETEAQLDRPGATEPPQAQRPSGRAHRRAQKRAMGSGQQEALFRLHSESVQNRQHTQGKTKNTEVNTVGNKQSGRTVEHVEIKDAAVHFVGDLARIQDDVHA